LLSKGQVYGAICEMNYNIDFVGVLS